MIGIRSGLLEGRYVAENTSAFEVRELGRGRLYRIRGFYLP